MSDAGSSLAYQRSVASSSSLSEMSVEIEHENDHEVATEDKGEVQQLFRSDDRSSWRPYTPATSAKDIEPTSGIPQYPLIIRREPHPVTHKIVLHSITVNSPSIRKILDRTFEGFEGLNTKLKQLTFKAPFHPFYYRWHYFTRLCQEESDPETKRHLNVLYPTLRDEIMPSIETMTDLLKNQVITFEYLWTIFCPGMEIYTKLDGQDRLYQLVDSRYGANMSGEFFTLETRYIDCDGSSFGYMSSSIDISKFEGVKKLSDIDAMPSHLHHDVEGLVERLYARGQKFEMLNGFHHMSYEGFYIARSSHQLRRRHLENGRIIIDPSSFNIHGSSVPILGALNDLDIVSVDNEILASIDNVVYQATSEALQKYRKALEKCERSRSGRITHGSKYLTPKQRLLCTPVVHGYCLAFKTWGDFYVENVSAISWNDNAFARLVLPHGYKEIIRAFVQEQLAGESKFDDIVSGKGLGFIMLLAGEPGVGKTLTAETVAEEMRRPLYAISASELGEAASEVEASLEQVLDLASKWNAILLLDECDMFLEARSISDIRRNRLVSVFLRQLEYYRGVMFLTSNRVSHFDAAFESRIHLTIRYPSFDTRSRLHVWKIFVQMGGLEHRLSEQDLGTLAKVEVNGREIKNTIKTARLLSSQENTPLALRHIEMVLRVKRGTFG